MALAASAGPTTVAGDPGSTANRPKTMAMWAVRVALIASILVYAKTLSERFIPPVAVFTVLTVISTALVFLVRRPWPNLVGGIVLGLSTATSFPFIVGGLTDPIATSHQAEGLLGLTLGVAGTIAGVTAFIEARRRTDLVPAFRAPLGEALAILAAGAIVGATYMSAMAYRAVQARPAVGGGVANGVESAPVQAPAELTSKDARFVQSSLTFKTGAATVYLVNKDNAEHTFDIDLQGKHYSYPIPANSTVAAVLNLRSAGTYTYFCAIPGHRGNGMEGKLTAS
ncbi:MAG: cupredoxin domain-containing protein [Candidatus Dormibacteria bacterium]